MKAKERGFLRLETKEKKKSMENRTQTWEGLCGLTKRNSSVRTPDKERYGIKAIHYLIIINYIAYGHIIGVTGLVPDQFNLVNCHSPPEG